MKPPKDRTYTGHPNGRTVTVVRDNNPAAQPLTFIHRHSDTGAFGWGYGPTGPAEDLARCLLLDAHPNSTCTACGGSGYCVWIGGEARAYNSLVELSADNDVEVCTEECDEGYAINRETYQRFKDQVIQHLSPDGWTMTRAEVLAWLDTGALPPASAPF